MLRYLTNGVCSSSSNYKPSETNAYLTKCNASLYNKATGNSKLFLYKRCLFMTFEEYATEKVHINNNMCCRVLDSVNETAMKDAIRTELEHIRGNLLRPS